MPNRTYWTANDFQNASDFLNYLREFESQSYTELLIAATDAAQQEINSFKLILKENHDLF